MKNSIKIGLILFVITLFTACSTIQSGNQILNNEDKEAELSQALHNFENTVARTISDSDWNPGIINSTTCDIDENKTMLILQSSGVSSQYIPADAINKLYNLLISAGYISKTPKLDFLPDGQMLILEGASKVGFSFRITIDEFNTIIVESVSECF